MLSGGNGRWVIRFSETIGKRKGQERCLSIQAVGGGDFGAVARWMLLQFDLALFSRYSDEEQSP